MDYRIGLDIGITSVGWAVLENGLDDEPKKLVKAGVRIFDKAENPKDGASLALPRREARGTRRRLRRRRHRMERIRNLFEQEGLISLADLEKMYNSKKLPDVYRIRYEALDRRLSDEELAQVLLHIAKHRGFKSNRKSEAKEEEGGKVLKALKANDEKMQANGYRTIGEMLYLDESFRIEAPWMENGYIIAPRNKGGDYSHTVLRSMLVDEVKIIFEKQQELGNTSATDSLRDKYIEIMTSQRSFDEGPGGDSKYAGNLIEGMVGKCTFEKSEKRASKASYTAVRFVMLQKINNLKIASNGQRKFLKEILTPEEFEDFKEYVFSKKETKYSDIRKKLKLSDDSRFVGLTYGREEAGKVEKTKFFELKAFYDIRKAMPKARPELNWEDMTETEKNLLDEVARILAVFKSDDKRTQELNKIGINYVDELLEINTTKFQNLSIKAMKKINVGLEKGMTYDKACEEVGYNFSDLSSDVRLELLKGDVVAEVLEDIPNPVVKRAISQSIKVLNAIIREYGSPQAVNIEMAREMAKNFNDRQKMTKKYEENQKNNETVRKEVRELINKEPTGMDIVKYKLWKEQDGVCLYSGAVIPLDRLFEAGVAEVDHAIPYSRCFDDSMKNKVLVTAKENRDKGNRTPYEYMGQDEERWNRYVGLVNQRIKDWRKKEHLLRTQITDEEMNEWKERSLTDTKYIAVEMLNLVKNNLKFAEYNNVKNTTNNKPHVFAINGVVTDYIKKRWGFARKDRRTDRHHALDAVVIACATQKMINDISRNIQARELEYSRGLEWVDVETGEILNRDNFTREQWDEKFGVQIPMPWSYFRDEVEIRLSENPEYFKKDLIKMGYDPNEKIEPMFVSRMPKHSVTGAGHKETIKSPKKYNEESIVITKTNLTELKLDKDGEIKNYYNKESDKLLYNALKRQLQLYGGDAKKAFAEDFYKPKADGTRGPRVRKVKLYDKQTTGVFVNGGTGIAANGSMIRVDIFRENGKYYMVPIYASDTVKNTLPNKAATAGKTYDNWREVKDEDFLFSLYKGDLIGIKHKSGAKLKLSTGENMQKQEFWAYYISTDIAGAQISGEAHDRSFSFRSLGIQSLEYLKKYQVDVLGNVTEVKHETRKYFR